MTLYSHDGEVRENVSCMSPSFMLLRTEAGDLIRSFR